MSISCFTTDIIPIETAGIVHNKAKITVEFDKGLGACVAKVWACEVSGPGFMRVALFSSPQTTAIIERGWKRTNAKKVLILANLLRAELDTPDLEEESSVVFAIREWLRGHQSDLANRANRPEGEAAGIAVQVVDVAGEVVTV